MKYSNTCYQPQYQMQVSRTGRLKTGKECVVPAEEETQSAPDTVWMLRSTKCDQQKSLRTISIRMTSIYEQHGISEAVKFVCHLKERTQGCCRNTSAYDRRK